MYDLIPIWDIGLVCFLIAGLAVGVLTVWIVVRRSK